MSDEARGSWAPWILSALGGIALLCLIAVALSRTSNSAPNERLTYRQTATPSAEPEPVVEIAAELPAAPIVVASVAESAAAMDETSIRQDINRLRLAVLSGDKVAVEGASGGLRRYGAHARPIVLNELAQEQNGAVRAALETLEKTLKQESR